MGGGLPNTLIENAVFKKYGNHNNGVLCIPAHKSLKQQSEIMALF